MKSLRKKIVLRKIKSQKWNLLDLHLERMIGFERNENQSIK